jgi:uncharacterized protein YrrD
MKLKIDNIDKLKGVSLNPNLTNIIIEECIEVEEEYRFSIQKNGWFLCLIILERIAHFTTDSGMNYYRLKTTSTNFESISKEDISNMDSFKGKLLDIIQ